MRLLLVGIGIGVIASLTSSGAHAQTPADVGVTVRIHSVNRDTERLTGVLLSATSQNLVIRLESGTTDVISTSTIKKVEVTEGSRRHAGHGALMGFVGGAAVGGAYGTFNDDAFGFGCDGYGCSGGEAVAGGAYLLSVLGALGGALVGGLVRTDDWVEVPPDLLYADRPAEELGVFLQRAKEMRVFPLSVALGLGPGHVGHGGGLSGHISVRVVPRTWGLGVRLNWGWTGPAVRGSTLARALDGLLGDGSSAPARSSTETFPSWGYPSRHPLT